MKCNLTLFPVSISRTTALVQILKKSFVGHFHSPTPMPSLHLRFYMLSLKRKEHISNLLNDTAQNSSMVSVDKKSLSMALKVFTYLTLTSSFSQPSLLTVLCFSSKYPHSSLPHLIQVFDGTAPR